LTLLRSGQDKGGIADTQFFIGLVYLARGEINEAEDRFMSALVNRQEDTKYEHRVTLNSYLADSAFRQEKWDEGFHYAEEARRLIRDHRLNYRQVRFVVTFAERYLTKHRYQDAFDTFAEAISLATFMDLRDYESILNKILDVIDGLVQTECFELAFRFCDTLIDSAISSPFSKTPESVLFWNRAKEYIQDPKNRRLREYVFRHD